MLTRSLAAALVAAAALAAPLAAQGPKPGAPHDSARGPVPEPKLIFDREVFSYPSDGRRDPFTALVGKNDAGPRFEDLVVSGIIYSQGGRSLVVLSDGKRMYRRHQGEMVGNARVVGILPARVIFTVDNFGSWRQESLELKKNPEGAKG